MNSCATTASRASAQAIVHKTKKAAAAALRTRFTVLSLQFVPDKLPTPPLQAALEIAVLERPFDVALNLRRVPHDLFRAARERRVDALEWPLGFDAQGAELPGGHAHLLPTHHPDVTLVAHMVGTLQRKTHFVARFVRIARMKRKPQQALVGI